MENNSKFLSKILSLVTLATLFLALSVTGVLWGFLRTIDGISDAGVPNPTEFLFGYGLGSIGFGYGYGYGYGSGDEDAGYYVTDSSGSTGGSSGGSSGGSASSSSSSSSSSSTTTTTTSNIDVNAYIEALKKLKAEAEQMKKDNEVVQTGLKLPAILPQTGTSIAEKGIKVYANSRVATSFPTWLQASSLASAPTDASHWINTIPYTEDRNADSYVVIPTTWVVAPINMAAADEMTKALNGETFDYDTPLQTGALHYPGTQMPGEAGNSVIFGHSSYYNNDGGRYKTIFGKIIELDAGEQVWVYKKNSDGEYDRMAFVVETSKEISPTDVEILLPKSGKNISLFTCTPIGGITGRWYVSARLIEDSSSEVTTLNVSSSMKVKINRAMYAFEKRVNTFSDAARLKAIATVAYRIELAEAKYEGNTKILDILQYIKLRLASTL